jgi:hypothetical protein
MIFSSVNRYVCSTAFHTAVADVLAAVADVLVAVGVPAFSVDPTVAQVPAAVGVPAFAVHCAP